MVFVPNLQAEIREALVYAIVLNAYVTAALKNTIGAVKPPQNDPGNWDSVLPNSTPASASIAISSFLTQLGLMFPDKTLVEWYSEWRLGCHLAPWASTFRFGFTYGLSCVGQEIILDDDVADESNYSGPPIIPISYTFQNF